MPVGEMAAVGEVHRQDFVTWLKHRKINGHVGLGSAVRLHIYVFAAEELLRAIDRELFGGIDVFATAVPTFLRITLRVFVGQDTPLRFHHCTTRELFL